MNLRTAIIVDIDGTLANCDHRRHLVEGNSKKKDWIAFYEGMKDDSLNVWCNCIINSFRVILVTGRPEEYRTITVDWVASNTCLSSYTPLFMRKTGDYRDDVIVKQEIYYEHIKGNYNILFVLDDRKKVVDMWRKNGLVCLQCAPGEF